MSINDTSSSDAGPPSSAAAAQVSKDASRLLGALPVDGGTIGNMRLAQSLGWDHQGDRYLRAKAELISAGLARPGRGRGGSLARTSSAPPPAGRTTGRNAAAVREAAPPFVVRTPPASASASPAPHAPAQPARSGGSGTGPTVGRGTAPDRRPARSPDKITLSQLESHLWEAANILRGPVDAADFKTYIFPLLFFKRVSDVHDEEHADALKAFGGDEEAALFPENYGFQVPEGCHWRDVRKVATNVGQALQTAMRGIEQANPHTLYGIFGDAQWTNKDRLSDALLRDLIEHFSRLPLGNRAAETDILGQAYEYLIKKFADATNKKAGEFYTPRSVVRLMVEILDPREGESIYDPACGTGGMLLEAIQHVKQTRGDVRTLWGRLYGQEKNLTTSAIARMNLFLHGAADFQIVRGDTLRNPAFYSGDNLAAFDCVIANPPFSLEKWGEEVWTSDPYGRNFAGMPPGKSGDYAFVQHMIKSMAPKTGRMAVVLPHGALFRMGKEGAIRKKLLGMDLLEAVIGLGPNLFYGTDLAACILVFRQRKAKDRKNKVLVVDASAEFKKGRAQNELRAEHVERIHGWVRDFQDVEGVARVVTLEEIAANDHNLNIPRYVEPKMEGEVLTVEEATQRLRESAEAAFAAEEKLVRILKREGLLVS